MDNFQSDSIKLKEIASDELLTNLQQLVIFINLIIVIYYILLYYGLKITLF